ncbi:MAG: c-type cytochrome [Halocynthiibacter sp.]
MIKHSLLALALTIPVTTAIAHAGSHEEDAIGARRGYFSLLGSDMGALAAFAKGEKEFDAVTSQRHADNLKALTTYSIAHLMVPGTSSTDMAGKTRAKAEIWTNLDDYMAKAGDFVAAVGELQANAGTLDGVRANLGKVGGTCKACHKDYRQKEF